MLTKLLQILLWLIVIPTPLFGWEGDVVEVIDGDSMIVIHQNRQVPVHLAAVDCPELGQPWGPQAKQLTALLVLDKPVTVWPSHEDEDGRLFVFVFIEDINLNKALLRAGLAWHTTKDSRDPLLTALEMEARVDKKGLWSEPNPVPPWEFKSGDDKAIETSENCPVWY